MSVAGYVMTVAMAIAPALQPFASPAASPAAATTAGAVRVAGVGRVASVNGVMQVVAHQDDDLFFMNPDVDQSIGAGLPSVTVYLTAGEISGNGDTAADRARNRQRGAQNAYAAMAGVEDGDDGTQREWAGEVHWVAGKQIERYQLRARTNVHLLFVNLRDYGLTGLSNGGEVDTVVPSGGLVSAASHYTRSDVVTVLHTIMEEYRPALLRTQDAEPEPGDDAAMVAHWSSDHPDHGAGARFAREAAARYSGGLYEASYRDYDTSSLAANLDPRAVARKTAIVEQYYRYDQAYQAAHSGDQWLARQYYRWPRGTGWAVRGGGRLEAFVVRGGLVQRYTETAAGDWSGPTRLADPRGRLAAGLAIGRNADGRLEIFAHRLSDHHLLALRQDTPGGSFRGAWTDLGTPDPGSARRDQVGSPVVVSNADGRLALFVKTATGGVGALTQTAANGHWSSSAWVALPGADVGAGVGGGAGAGVGAEGGVLDGLSAVTTASGRIELFASTRTRILRWRQTQPNGAVQLDASFPAMLPASPPRAIVDAAGRVQVAYLQPDTGRLQVTQQLGPDSDAWRAQPVDLADPGEIGEPAMTLSPASQNGRVMVFARNRTAGISASVQGQPDATYGGWGNLGGLTFDQPSAAAGGNGQAAVFTIGSSGVSMGTVSVDGTRPSVKSWRRLG